jgi:hypothetical protein
MYCLVIQLYGRADYRPLLGLLDFRDAAEEGVTLVGIEELFGAGRAES